MAQMQDVDTSNAEELNEGFTVFPPGEYILYMEASERKATNAGDGEYLSCTFTVAEGEFEGRKVFHMFNLWNKSQQATDIAKSQWKALCEAAVGQPNAPNGDSSSLHFKKFLGTVGVDPAKDNYAAKNKLIFRKGTVKSIGGSAAQPAVAKPVAATPQQNHQTAPDPAQAVGASVGGRPAWAKR
jgi:hypothetical protein